MPFRKLQTCQCDLGAGRERIQAHGFLIRGDCGVSLMPRCLHAAQHRKRGQGIGMCFDGGGRDRQRVIQLAVFEEKRTLDDECLQLLGICGED